MNLPNLIKGLLRPKQTREVFLSLVLARDGVAASAWYVDSSGAVHTLSFAQADVPKDNWEDRTEAADRAIAAVEEKLDETTQIRKTVLGLPADYLTQNGDIEASVRPALKRLTQALDLTPIGFVSLPQALVYKLKKDEGMPPSVILLGFSDNQIVLTLYKVGAVVGQRIAEYTEQLSPLVEQELKSFKELEVLPSRILLYGMKVGPLEEGKIELLRHPWPTKANFLHFPKFDQIVPEETLASVSLAGASEIATAIGEEPEEMNAPQELPKKEREVGTPQAHEEEQELTSEPEEEKAIEEAEPNVELVEPEELGFQKEDILEEVQSSKFKIQNEKEQEIKEKAQKIRLPIKLPKMKFPKFSSVSLPKIKLRGGIVIASIIIGLLVLFGVINWAIPKATITVLAIAQTIQSPLTATVDPTATVADSQNKIIPGHTRQDQLSGEKTIPVTGTKKVGDPAKGGVTIYNKSLTAKTFKKGTTLSASGLNFTLDSDVSVASASESIGSITFGKATGTATASDIGPESNIPAGTEFTFKDSSSSVAIARNDQALAGGTSRQVTVVSRADYDTLVSELTDELLAKAKEKLTTSISGGEKLIDQTVKTTVTEKNFTQEIDQEANQLNGKITITVSGVSYNDGDLAVLFDDASRDKLQSGYALVKDRTEAKAQNIQVKKDGKIILATTVTGIALPTFDVETIKKEIAGKTLSQAQEYLKTIAGVGGAEFRFRWTTLPNRLPMNKNNISVTVAVQ